MTDRKLKFTVAAGALVLHPVPNIQSHVLSGQVARPNLREKNCSLTTAKVCDRAASNFRILLYDYCQYFVYPEICMALS